MKKLFLVLILTLSSSAWAYDHIKTQPGQQKAVEVTFNERDTREPASIGVDQQEEQEAYARHLSRLRADYTQPLPDLE